MQCMSYYILNKGTSKVQVAVPLKGESTSDQWSPPIVPRHIFYRSYKHFDKESYVRDLNSAPFVICDIFDDPDDKAWCFTKVLSDVIEKNAPVKSKVIKKP